jgi:hypothetical protein
MRLERLLGELKRFYGRLRHRLPIRSRFRLGGPVGAFDAARSGRSARRSSVPAR